MNFRLPSIYPITDQRISGVSHLEQVKRLVAGGATFLQLREKHASPREFYQSAKAAIELAGTARVIINDRVDIALAVGAAGVHLGQNDIPLALARKVLGDSAIIGLSTHTADQARAAIGLPIDYLAFGPIFPTSTKDDPEHVVGLDGLRRVRDIALELPVVAIGGITEKNLIEVLQAGADSVAVISAILSGDITHKMHQFLVLAEAVG